MKTRTAFFAGTALAIVALSAPLQAQERAFNLPAQAATRSIPEFARQAGLQIIAPSDQLEGVTTPAIKGKRDARAALKALIANTGLEIASDSGGVIVLRRQARQAAAKDSDSAPAAEERVDIVVTGTRIRSPGADAPNPVTSVPANRFFANNGGISIGDQLSLLPQFRTTQTQSASTQIGTQAPGQVGINLLDLRGLGTTRTLVLQNGRRLVSSTQQLSQPDTNTIPVQLLERVDILTGGASSVYGADAIAGVVNFVLKDNYEGLEANLQAGISAKGDAGAQSAGIVAGKNFADNRGNIALAVQYANRDGLRYTDREFSQGQSDFVNNPQAGQPGQPANVPINDIRYLAYSTGGTLPYGNPYYRFQPDGTLQPANTGTRVYPNLGISDGGDGLSPIAEGSLLPENERWSGTLLGHFDVSDGLTLFGQVDYIHQRSLAYGSSYLGEFVLSKNNPYLSSQALGVLNSYGPTANSPVFVMERSLPDLGVFGERDKRETARGVIGAKGSLTDNLRYEVSYSYGRTSITTDFINNVNLRRADLAADAVRDTAGVLGTPGAIVCASRLAAPTSTDPDIAQCRPANYFGLGNISDAARNYITLTTTSRGRIEQHLAGGFLAGDTGGFFNLPGGPVDFVIGSEFRRESTNYVPDPRDTVGNTLAGGERTSGSVEVIEGYGEVKLPLIADRPFFDRLELSASGRLSHYNLTKVGTKGSWGVGMLYRPYRDLTLRSSYQKAVRAPNISELFAPRTTGQTQIIDPCDARFINNGTSTRRANCAALGIPADYRAPTIPTTITTVTSGNPDLDVERGTTYTFGATFNPGFLRQFSFSADYYHIDLRGAIAQANGNIINPSRVPSQCVDAQSIDNPFCGLVVRNSNNLITQVSQYPINLTRLVASGIDFDARYGLGIGRDARLDLRAIASYVISRDDYRSPSQPDFRTQVVETPSNPRWQANFNTALRVGAIRLEHTVRYFSGVYYKNDDVAFYETVNGVAPLNPNRRPAEYTKTKDGFFNDLRVSVSFGEGREFYLGVDNIGDVTPPFSMYGAGGVGAQFDSVGRYFYAGIRTRL